MIAQWFVGKPHSDQRLIGLVRVIWVLTLSGVSVSGVHTEAVTTEAESLTLHATTNTPDLDYCDKDKENNMFCRIRTPEMVGTKILTLSEEETRNKRMFVIGDVHGCFDELTSLLFQCNALLTDDVRDGLKDDVIIVFVGDLVNKGPKSTEVLEFVRSTENVYTVLGNHEVYWLEREKGGPDVTNFFQSLPYVISIPQYNALVVHAGFMPAMPIQQQRTKDITHMRNVISRRLESGGVEQVAYEETDQGTHWAQLWTGAQHVYFGHDARRGQDEQGRPRVQRFPRATGLDTRCVKGGALTAVKLPVATEEFYSVSCPVVYSQT